MDVTLTEALHSSQRLILQNWRCVRLDLESQNSWARNLQFSDSPLHHYWVKTATDCLLACWSVFCVINMCHNERIAQHLPAHMLFLRAATCRCWLKMLTKTNWRVHLAFMTKISAHAAKSKCFLWQQANKQAHFIAAHFLTKSSAVHSYPGESLKQTMAGNRHIQLNPTGERGR